MNHVLSVKMAHATTPMARREVIAGHVLLLVLVAVDILGIVMIAHKLVH